MKEHELIVSILSPPTVEDGSGAQQLLTTVKPDPPNLLQLFKRLDSAAKVGLLAELQMECLVSLKLFKHVS